MKQRKVEYAGAGISEVHKTHIAQIALKLKNLDWSENEICQLLNDTEYAPGKSTLRRHMALLSRGEDLFTENKQTGRPSLLTDKEWAAVCGWIILGDNPRNYESAIKFVFKNFGVEVSPQSMGQNMRRLEMSNQLTGSLLSEVNGGTLLREKLKDHYIESFHEWNGKRVVDKHL